MSLDEKLKKLELLTAIHTTVTKTCMNLYQEGQTELALKVEEINLHLSVAIEELTHKTLEEWISLSQNYIAKVEPQLVTVQGCLDEINKNLKDSKKIAKSIGKIDKTLQSVLKLVT